MEQRLTFITLGVLDLPAMVDFYRDQFGWQPLKELDGIVFFKLNGIILGLFPKEELAKDAGVPDDGSGFKNITMAINFHSEAEVDVAFSELEKKGVNIIKAPEKVFWGGYSGYVEDIEHNLWELAHNPFLEMDGEGNVTGHK